MRQYEDQGLDYPYAFVRWTEQRNIEAVLQMMASGRLNVEPLITKRLPSDRAAEAYDLLVQDRNQLGIVLQYPTGEPPRTQIIPLVHADASTAAPAVSAGKRSAGWRYWRRQFCQPGVAAGPQRKPAQILAIASASGISAAHAARKFNIAACTSDSRVDYRRPEH